MCHLCFITLSCMAHHASSPLLCMPTDVFALELLSLCVMLCVLYVYALSMSVVFFSFFIKCLSERVCASVPRPATQSHTQTYPHTSLSSHFTSQVRAPQFVFSPHSSRSLPCDLRNQLFPNGPRPVPQGPGEHSHTKAPSSSPCEVR